MHGDIKVNPKPIIFNVYVNFFMTKSFSSHELRFKELDKGFTS